ncbi:MAG: cell division protein ZapA (FtsZ GTPase activity inhibitor) [Flavobacteriaceae bacterium]|jgi:cell division protein ZapA (FtsZ GTPase activity inhibitor)
MAKQSLKVVVAGRTYPLSVSGEEANKVEKAAKDINKAIKLLQESYAVKDMQDLLAMTALQLAVKDSKGVAITPTEDLEKIEDELNELIKELDK